MTRSIYFVILISLLSSIPVFGLDDNIVVIKQLSSSGKTVYINRGKFEDIGKDDYGVLVVQQKFDDQKFIYKPVANIRNIKIKERESAWIAYKIFIPGALKVGRKFIFLSESSLLKGRAALKIKRTSLVTNKDTKKEVKDFMLEGDELSKKKNDYSVIDIPHVKEKSFESDVDMIDVEKWEGRTGDNKLYVNGIYRSPHAKEFSRRKRVQTFEKMVVAFLKKYNDPDFEYDKFYRDQRRGKTGYLSNKSLFGNYKDSYDERNVEKVKEEEAFLRKLRKKGEAWSEEYDDRQLSNLLNRLSIVKEKERRRDLIAYKFDYQAFLGFGLNLVNNENLNDAKTTEQSKYDVEFGIEGYFFKNLEALQKITMEFGLRKSQDAFFGGDLNVRSTEYSMAAHLNWYPFKRASAINTNILYIGLLTRYGVSTLSNDTSDEIGNYQVFTLPGVRGGLKYNFSNSYGFRIMMGYENIRVERLVRNADDGSLPDRTNYTEGKLSFSLSKFF